MQEGEGNGRAEKETVLGKRRFISKESSGKKKDGRTGREKWNSSTKRGGVSTRNWSSEKSFFRRTALGGRPQTDEGKKRAPGGASKEGSTVKGPTGGENAC